MFSSFGQGYEGLEAELPACLVCKGVIMSPVCPDCLEKQVLVWLSETNPDAKLLLARSPIASLYPHSGVSCILCSRSVDICAHCYCNEVSSVLSDNPALSREFLCMFNFELGR